MFRGRLIRRFTNEFHSWYTDMNEIKEFAFQAAITFV